MKMFATVDGDLRVTLHVDARHEGKIVMAK